MAAPRPAKELSEEEIEDYKEAFRNFDKDGDGNIDEGELGVVMRSLGYSPTNQQLKEMMNKVRVWRVLRSTTFFFSQVVSADARVRPPPHLSADLCCRFQPTRRFEKSKASLASYERKSRA